MVHTFTAPGPIYGGGCEQRRGPCAGQADAMICCLRWMGAPWETHCPAGDEGPACSQYDARGTGRGLGGAAGAPGAGPAVLQTTTTLTRRRPWPCPRQALVKALCLHVVPRLQPALQLLLCLHRRFRHRPAHDHGLWRPPKRPSTVWWHKSGKPPQH